MPGDWLSSWGGSVGEPPRAWLGAPQVLRGSVQGEYPKGSLRSIPSSMRKYTGHPKWSVQTPQVLRGKRCPGAPPSALPGAPQVLRGSPHTQAAVRLAPQPGAGGNNTGSEGAAWTRPQSGTLGTPRKGPAACRPWATCRGQPRDVPSGQGLSMRTAAGSWRRAQPSAPSTLGSALRCQQGSPDSSRGNSGQRTVGRPGLLSLPTGLRAPSSPQAALRAPRLPQHRLLSQAHAQQWVTSVLSTLPSPHPIQSTLEPKAPVLQRWEKETDEELVKGIPS